MSVATGKCLKWAPLFAVPLAVALALLAEICGNIHGSPACGPLSFVAVPITVLGLLLEQLLFPDPQSGLTVRLLIWSVAYLVALPFAFAVLWFRSLLKGN